MSKNIKFIVPAIIVLILILFFVFSWIIFVGIYSPFSGHDADISSCESLRGWDKDYCYFNLTHPPTFHKIPSNALEVCSLISNQTLNRLCQDLVYAPLAKYKNDISYCDKMSDINKVVVLNIRNFTIFGENMKDACYYSAAQRLSDPSICAKMIDHMGGGMDYKRGCYIISPKDLEGCAEIPNDDWREKCEQRIKRSIATKNDDPELCAELIYPDYRNTCYIDVASEKLDIKICEKIDNQRQKDLCVGVIALNKKDTELCSRITDEKMRDNCRNSRPLLSS